MTDARMTTAALYPTLFADAHRVLTCCRKPHCRQIALPEFRFLGTTNVGFWGQPANMWGTINLEALSPSSQLSSGAVLPG